MYVSRLLFHTVPGRSSRNSRNCATWSGPLAAPGGVYCTPTLLLWVLPTPFSNRKRQTSPRWKNKLESLQATATSRRGVTECLVCSPNRRSGKSISSRTELPKVHWPWLLEQSGNNGGLMADQQYTKRLLSADSHVMEPRDLWESASTRNGATRPRASRCSTKAVTT